MSFTGAKSNPEETKKKEPQQNQKRGHLQTVPTDYDYVGQSVSIQLSYHCYGNTL
jgi:hypothetical protein